MRAHRRTSCLLFALAVIGITPPCAVGQTPSQQADDMIPRELVLALLNFGPGMGGAAEIRVGRLPDGVPADLVPPGLIVIGSTSQFDNSVIVLAAPDQPDSATAGIERFLLANGWTKPPMPQFRSPRGFVAADFMMGSYQQPDIACRNDSFVTYSAAYRRSGGSIVRLVYNRGQQYSACRLREQVAVARNPYEETPIPTLRAPMGAVMKDGNSSSMSSVGGATGMAISTRLGTRLKPAEVVAHYDKQLREQGWTPGAEGAVPFLAARSYRKTDDKSQAWTAVLVSMALVDSTEQDVALRVTRR